MSLSALSAGKSKKHPTKTWYKPAGHKSMKLRARPGYGKKKRAKSHKRAKSRKGGSAAAQIPQGYEYFQDYAQVGGAAPSFYDNYAAYADPRVAGAYDPYAAYYDPRVAGAYSAPLAPVDPYADWTQARYAGSMDAYGAPLVGGEGDMNAAGYGWVKSHMARKPHKTTKHKVEGHYSHASKKKKPGVKRRKSSRSRKGGLEMMANPLVGGAYEGYDPMVGGAYGADPYAYASSPLVGGAYDPYQQGPQVGGYDLEALTGGAKKRRKSRSRSHSKKRKRSHSKKRRGGAEVAPARTAGRRRSRSRSHSKKRKHSKKRRHSRKHYGGAAEIAPMPLVGGGAYAYDPLTGGAYGFDMEAAAAALGGGKKVKSVKRRPSLRKIKGRKTKIHVKGVYKKRRTSRSRSASRRRKH